MTNTPTPEQVAKALKGVTPGPWHVGQGDRVPFVAGNGMVRADLVGPESERLPNARFIAWARNNVEALAADRDEQKARADAMQRGYDELYADALADAQSDAQEFDGELWKRLRDYLTELNLDWSDYTEDGIMAEQAIEHIRECMDGETARADAAEAALAAEKAKVARLVDAAIPFAHVAELFDSEVEGVGAFDTLSLWLNGDDEEPAWRAMHFTLGDFGKLQAAIAEVQE